MMPCERCGGQIQLGALSCSFCGAPTAAAARIQEQRLQAAAWSEAQAGAQERQRQAFAVAQMNAAASSSLTWSLVGLLFFCLPVLSIVAIVKGFRARTLAGSIRAPAPARAIVGLVVGAFTVLGFFGFWTFAIIESQKDVAEVADRRAKMEKELADKVVLATIEHDTACKLAELHLLTEGFEGSSATYLQGFECIGKWTIAADRGALEDFRFRTGSTSPPKRTTVCFKHGLKWYLDEVRSSGPCAESDVKPAEAKTSEPAVVKPRGRDR